MQRDDFRCQMCSDSTSMLQVHHRFYIRGKLPWEYEADMLITLCESCHVTATEEMDLLRYALAYIHPRDVGRVTGYVASLGAVGSGRTISLEIPGFIQGIADETRIDPWWFEAIAKKGCGFDRGETYEFIKKSDREDAIDVWAEDILP